MLFANIIHNDIADVTYTPNNMNMVAIDFNNDGTPEFSFDEQWDGIVGTWINPAEVNFITIGDFNSGHGWDIIKSLPVNHTIDNSGLYGSEGDAYINADWANPSDLFPEGISFVGVTFKLDANRHYGWMRVNSTSGVITLLDYAYNDVPDTAITTGQTTLAIDEYAKY